MLSYRHFIGLFLLFTLINTVSLIAIQSRQSDLLEATRSTLEKLNIQRTAAIQMANATHERSLLLLRMTYIEDPFEREEMSEVFAQEAVNFLTNLEALEATELDRAQRSMLNDVLKMVQPTSLLLVESITRMRNNEQKAAATIVANQVLPNQDLIIRQLEKLTKDFTAKADLKIGQSLELTKDNRWYFTLLMTWIVFQVVLGSLIIYLKFRHDRNELAKVEKISDNILQTAFDAIISFNEKGKFSRFNDAAARLSSFRPREILNQPLSRLLPAALTDRIAELIHSTDLDGHVNFKALNTETFLTRKDGTTVPVAISLSDTGIVSNMRFTAVLHDLSQIKAALQEVEQQKNALDEHSIVSVTDVNGKIVYVNDLFCKTSGFQREEMIGKNHRMLNAGMHEQSYWDDMYNSLHSGKTWHHELSNTTKQGKTYWVDTTIVPFRDTEGNLKNFVAISTDITKRVESENALKQQQEKLEQLVEERTHELLIAKDNAEAANREKSRFLANMSHELRTPMHAILSFGKLGLNRIEKANKEKLATYFSRIVDGSERLTELLNGLLDLSKMEAGKMDYHFEHNLIHKDLRIVTDELAPLSKAKHLQVNINHDGQEATAEYDSPKIIQVVRNLLSNAIKFSDNDSTITIEVVYNADLTHWGLEAGQFLQVSVKDEGIGIPDAELQSIFGHFIQSSKTRTNAGGTGLGLSISREIIEAHNGMIRARNNYPGAIVEFIIPLNQADPNSGH